MAIDTREFTANEAWLLFQLSSAPIKTEADGDFDAIAIMDVASGLIYGMELVSVGGAGISEFQSRKLVSSAESKAGSRPSVLFIPSNCEANHLAVVAGKMGISVEKVPKSECSQLIKEAVDSFAAYVSGNNST